MTLSAEFTEHDSSPDYGRETVKRVISQNDLERGFKETFNVYVREDRGRYSGYVCTWKVTFHFSRV